VTIWLAKSFPVCLVHIDKKKKKKKKKIISPDQIETPTVDRLAQTAFMTEMWRGLWVAFAWQFQPKVTLNYPFEKGPVSSIAKVCHLFKYVVVCL
jgi:hypothetical protein